MVISIFRKSTRLSFVSWLFIFATLPVFAIDPWDSPEDGGVLLHKGWQLHDVPSLKFADVDAAGTITSQTDYVPSGWMQATLSQALSLPVW